MDFTKLLDILSRLLSVLNVTLASILTFLAHLIGYPSHILNFIFTLIVLDIITKHFALIILRYDDISIRLYFQAWKDRVLTSRRMRVGVTSKLLIYLPLMMIATHIKEVHELSMLMPAVNFIYMAIISSECYSLLENFLLLSGNSFLTKKLKKLSEIIDKVDNTKK